MPAAVTSRGPNGPGLSHQSNARLASGIIGQANSQTLIALPRKVTKTGSSPRNRGTSRRSSIITIGNSIKRTIIDCFQPGGARPAPSGGNQPANAPSSRRLDHDSTRAADAFDQTAPFRRGQPGIELPRRRKADQRSPSRLLAGWRLQISTAITGKLGLCLLDPGRPISKRALQTRPDPGRDDLGDAALRMKIGRLLLIRHRAVEQSLQFLIERRSGVRHPPLAEPARIRKLQHHLPLGARLQHRDEFDADEAGRRCGDVCHACLPREKRSVRGVADAQPDGDGGGRGRLIFHECLREFRRSGRRVSRRRNARQIATSRVATESRGFIRACEHSHRVPARVDLCAWKVQIFVKVSPLPPA